MALADSRLQRVVTLCILYFAQGVPYGFMTITMANYLSGEGLSTDRVGALTAVVNSKDTVVVDPGLLLLNCSWH